MTRTGLFSPQGTHTTAFYFALFLAMGAHLPYWPIWLEDWGLSAKEVGIYSSIGVAIRVIAGTGIPILADRLDARRKTLAYTCAIGSILFIAHIWIGSRMMLLLATMATGGSSGPG